MLPKKVHYHLECACTPEEAIARIRDAVVKKQVCRTDKIRIRPDNMVFSARDYTFTYRNSFLPVVRIDFTRKTQTTDVHICLDLQDVVKALVWYGYIILWTITALIPIIALLGQPEALFILPVPFAMSFATYFLSHRFFKSSCRIVYGILSESLEPVIAQNRTAE